MWISVFLAVQQRNLGASVYGGWLYQGGETREVRFITTSVDPKNRDTFFPAPQNSGFIIIDGNTFSVSIAEAWGMALLDYRNGKLQERYITSPDGGLGDLHNRKETKMPFGQAFETAMTEVGGDLLGVLCSEILANPVTRKSIQEIHRPPCDLVLGSGRGALESFTQTPAVPSADGTIKRITCTFTVIVGRES